MPLTFHQWARQDNEAPGGTGWPSDVFTPVSYALSPSDGHVWTDLVRVECSVVASMWVESGLPAGGWVFGGITAMVGLKFQPSAEDPGMARSDESPNVLGIYPLIPTVAGNPGGSAPYSVTWTTDGPISVRTQRKLSPTLGGIVYAYMWLDIGDVGSGNFGWKANLAALYAR